MESRQHLALLTIVLVTVSALLAVPQARSAYGIDRPGSHAMEPIPVSSRGQVPETPAVRPPSPPDPLTVWHSPTTLQGTRTSINGTVKLSGTLTSNLTTLIGGVQVTGNTVTTGSTVTTGTATYGTTRVQGSLSMMGNTSSSQPVMSTVPGSAIYLDPPSSVAAATMSLTGDISLGSNSNSFLLNSVGTTLTIWSNASGGGGIYGSGGRYTMNPASSMAITNYGPSTITVQCTIGIPLVCPQTVSPGSTSPSPCVLGLCITVSSMTWNGPVHFTVQGAMSTSSPGLYVSVPDGHLTEMIPGGAGANFSMIPSQGSPVVTVSRNSSLVPSVSSYGDLLVTSGVDIAANVTVSGTFSAAQRVTTNGTFYNSGGLTIRGALVSHGEQLFPGYLSLGPRFNITSYSSKNLTVVGRVIADPGSNGTAAVDLKGFISVAGVLSINGNFTQNSTGCVLGGNTTITGLVSASGSVLTRGKTEFLGNLVASGNITLPNTFLGGSLTARSASMVGVGTTNLSGRLSINGTTTISQGLFVGNGSSTLSGTIVGNKSFTLTGSATMVTKWGESLSLSSKVYMGGVTTVVGSVTVVGTVNTSGVSTFSSTSVDLSSGLTLAGVATTRGSVSVVGTTLFTGAVTTSGVAVFPGMTMTGKFHLSSNGGSVLASGTSSVNGYITLSGQLTVIPASGGTPGTFHENGNSAINGTLTMTGSVVVTGSTTLTTTSGTELSMHGNIQLGPAAHIVGYVNTSGKVLISGSATLGGGDVIITGSLSEEGKVHSEGDITLSGEASFSGNMSTIGTTRLPGITTVGNFSMTGGKFVLQGVTTLKGMTNASGNVIVNSSGYFVNGTNSIHGSTNSTGSFTEEGLSSLNGSATVGQGSTFGTYMEVIGTLNTGMLSLSGTTILPDDTITFTSSAVISGTVRLTGTFSGSGTTVVFLGSSQVVGTVSSSTLPQVRGPVVTSFLGAYFGLVLEPEFFWFVGAGAIALILIITDIVIFLRSRGKNRNRSPSSVRARAVRRSGSLTMVAGLLIGFAGGFSLGGALATSTSPTVAASLPLLYWVTAALVTMGALLWISGRVLSRRERKRTERLPPSNHHGELPPWPYPLPPPEDFRTGSNVPPQ